MTQMVKNLPAMQKTQVQSLGQEDPLEKNLENPLDSKETKPLNSKGNES